MHSPDWDAFHLNPFLRIFGNQTALQWLTLLTCVPISGIFSQEESQLWGTFTKCCELSLTALLVLAPGSWRGKEVAFLLRWVAGSQEQPTYTAGTGHYAAHATHLQRWILCRYWGLDIYISTYWDTQPISRPRVWTHSGTCLWHTDTLATRQTQQTTYYI